MSGFSKWIISAFVLIPAFSCLAQSASHVAISGNDLLRAVIANELRQSDHGDWIYQVEKEQDGKKQSTQVVQTRNGSLERLLGVDGQMLSPQMQQQETARIRRVSSSRQDQQKLEQDWKKTAEQCEAFLKMMPEAWLISFVAREGEYIRLSFQPNPNYQPPTWEARVIHALSGEILVHSGQQRLAAIDGHLGQDVKFGGGLLGHLEKGGQFSVRRSEVGPGQWMLTDMQVNMRGKALFLKTIGLQKKEYRSNFRKLSNDLTLQDAGELLMGNVLVALRR